MKKSSDKLKVSVSAGKTYEQCPRKYFFTYIAKLPKKDFEHLRLGKFVHAVLEDFHNALLADASQDLAALMTSCFKNRLVEYKDQLKPESKMRAHEMLSVYLAAIRKDGMPTVIANEKPFSIELGDDVLIRGVIDRIDRNPDGTFTITDYKTGKSKYLDEFQLIVYGLTLLEDYPDLEVFKGSYIVLGEGSKKINYTFSRTDIDRSVQHIKKLAHMIRTDQTWEPRPSFLCKWCDFEDACPATQAKRALAADSTWTQASRTK